MKKSKWFKNYLNFWRLSLTKRGEKAFLVGTPIHGNLGDHAITLGEYKYLESIDYNKAIIEIPSIYIREHTKLFKLLIGKSDVLIHGGGFIGSLWPVEEEMVEKVLTNFVDNKVIFFPQTIYFSDDEEGKKHKKKCTEIYDSHNNMYVFVREETSYVIGKDDMKLKRVHLVPDMALLLDSISVENKKNVILCLRNDREKVLSKEVENQIIAGLKKYYEDEEIIYTDTVIDKNVWERERHTEVYKKVNEFANSKIVVTDRLHGMVFALLAGTSCIVFGNVNYKVKGLYQWIKNNGYIRFVNNIEEFDSVISEIKQCRNNAYDKKSIENEYKQLEKVLLSER